MQRSRGGTVIILSEVILFADLSIVLFIIRASFSGTGVLALAQYDLDEDQRGCAKIDIPDFVAPN